MTRKNVRVVTTISFTEVAEPLSIGDFQDELLRARSSFYSDPEVEFQVWEHQLDWLLKTNDIYSRYVEQTSRQEDYWVRDRECGIPKMVPFNERFVFENTTNSDVTIFGCKVRVINK